MISNQMIQQVARMPETSTSAIRTDTGEGVKKISLGEFANNQKKRGVGSNMQDDFPGQESKIPDPSIQASEVRVSPKKSLGEILLAYTGTMEELAKVFHKTPLRALQRAKRELEVLFQEVPESFCALRDNLNGQIRSNIRLRLNTLQPILEIKQEEWNKLQKLKKPHLLKIMGILSHIAKKKKTGVNNQSDLSISAKKQETKKK